MVRARRNPHKTDAAPFEFTQHCGRIGDGRRQDNAINMGFIDQPADFVRQIVRRDINRLCEHPHPGFAAARPDPFLNLVDIIGAVIVIDQRDLE